MSTKHTYDHSKRASQSPFFMRLLRQNLITLIGAELLVLCALIGVTPSFAEPTSFVLGPSSGNWVTLDQYDNRVETLSTDDMTKENSADQGFTNSLFEQEKQRRAMPQRPLDLPIMPSASVRGDGKSRELKNSLSLDEHIQLPEEDGKKIWVSVDDLKQRENDKKWADLLYHPLSKQNPGRLSVLPSSSVKATPASRISRPRGDTVQEVAASSNSEKKTDKESPVKKTEPANNDKVKIPAEMCDELNDYRRRQLEAMETDRKTLAALKKALSEVGLTDKEGYITEGDRSGKIVGDVSNSPPAKKPVAQ